VGLLDNKTRIVDTILTQKGREQLSAGGLRPVFYIFEDADIVYKNNNGIVEDASNVCYFEAAQKQQDILVPTTNEFGELLYTISGTINIVGGRAFNVSGSVIVENDLLNSDDIITSLDPTTALKFISPLQSTNVFDNNDFDVKPNNVQFSIFDEKPLNKRLQNGDVEHMDTFVSDPLLSHIINFAYLPPVNENKEAIGNYVPVGSNIPVSDSDALSELSDKETLNCYINPKPLNNRTSFQMFCVSNGKVIKLHAIDRGLINGTRIIYYGKVYKNSLKQFVFCRIFTLALSK